MLPTCSIIASEKVEWRYLELTLVDLLNAYLAVPQSGVSRQPRVIPYHYDPNNFPTH